MKFEQNKMLESMELFYVLLTRLTSLNVYSIPFMLKRLMMWYDELSAETIYLKGIRIFLNASFTDGYHEVLNEMHDEIFQIQQFPINCSVV